jgi:hypothetical protein
VRRAKLAIGEHTAKQALDGRSDGGSAAVSTSAQTPLLHTNSAKTMLMVSNTKCGKRGSSVHNPCA